MTKVTSRVRWFSAPSVLTRLYAGFTRNSRPFHFLFLSEAEMNEQGKHLHLLRDGELVDAVITRIPSSRADLQDDGCSLEVSYRGRKLRAYGTDANDALVALRGALEVDGLFLNTSRARLAA
jgi:hypothetical protein